MQLKQPLTQLPIRFDAERLAAEIAALPTDAWTPHPNGFPGNDAVRLVTPEGKDSDRLFGPMAPTEQLKACPYIVDIMADLGAVWGRSRLMGLGPGADVPPHVDINYYWRTHVRIHIPIVTNPGVEFTVDGETRHLAAGECWALDTFRSHTVSNRGEERRVHLVLDTVGGERLWDLVRQGESGASAGPVAELSRAQVDRLQFERVNAPKIMSPWEIKCHIADLLAATRPDPALDAVAACLDRFITGWASAWARFEADDAGLADYARLLQSVRTDLRAIPGEQLTLANGRALYFVLDALVFSSAMSEHRGARQASYLGAPGARPRLAS
jgi:hypothetical protein